MSGLLNNNRVNLERYRHQLPQFQIKNSIDNNITKNLRLLEKLYVGSHIAQTIVKVPVEDALVGATDDSFALFDDIFDLVRKGMCSARLYGFSIIKFEPFEEGYTLRLLDRSDRMLNSDSEYNVWYSNGIINKNDYVLITGEAPKLDHNIGNSVLSYVYDSLNLYYKIDAVLYAQLDQTSVSVYQFNDAVGEIDQEELNNIATAIGNKNLLAIEKDASFNILNTNLEWYKDISDALRIKLAGATSVPYNKLFGEGVEGFGSGQDTENIYKSLLLKMRDQATKIYSNVLKLFAYKNGITTPVTNNLTFPLMDHMTHEQKLEVLKLETDMLLSELEAGLFDQTEYFKRKQELFDKFK